MLVPLIRNRLMDALEGTPTVLEVLMAGLGDADPIWDRRLNPERFTLREMLAHLVDYDAIWNEYLDLALVSAAGYAEVPLYKPDEVAAKRDYSQTDPRVSLSDFRTYRTALVKKLRALEADAWTGHGIVSARHGRLNIDALSTLFIAHDGYHTRQAAEYRCAI